MTANNSIELFGSELHLQKPLKISDLSSLWKYTLWRMEDRMVITADVEGFGRFESEEIIVNNNRECRSFMNTGGQTLQGVIIREHNHTREGNKSESLMLGRKRLSRTYDSHAELAGTSGKFGLEFLYLFVIFAVAISYKSNTCFSDVKLLQIKEISLGMCQDLKYRTLKAIFRFVLFNKSPFNVEPYTMA